MQSFALCAAFCFVSATAALAQNFTPYPSSRLEEKATRALAKAGGSGEVYTSGDAFDAVYAYYRKLYKEVQFAPPPPRLPSGATVRWAFFTIDGAPNLGRSTFWLKIQRPYIGSISETGDGDFTDIRNVTAIQTVRPGRHVPALPTIHTK